MLFFQDGRGLEATRIGRRLIADFVPSRLSPDRYPSMHENMREAGAAPLEEAPRLREVFAF